MTTCHASDSRSLVVVKHNKEYVDVHKWATIHRNVWVPIAATASPVGCPLHTWFCQPLSLHICTYRSTTIEQIACAELPKTKRDQCLSKPNIHVTIANNCFDCTFRRNCQIEKCADPLVLKHTNIGDCEPGVIAVHLLLRAQSSRVHVSHSGNMPPLGKSDLPPPGKPET